MGCRRWCYKAISRQPNPTQSLQLQQSSNLHRPQLQWQSACSERFNYRLFHLNNCTKSIMKWTGSYLTSWAIMKATTSNIPGRSTKDQLLDRVTNMRAWLMVLTCRYIAEASFRKSSWAVFSRVGTPNTRWKRENQLVICENHK